GGTAAAERDGGRPHQAAAIQPGGSWSAAGPTGPRAERIVLSDASRAANCGRTRDSRLPVVGPRGVRPAHVPMPASILTPGGVMLVESRRAYRQIFCRASRHVKTTSGGIASPTSLSAISYAMRHTP